MSTTQSHLVTRNKIYYYRKAVPVDLQHQYGKREIVFSLKTSHQDAALVLFSSMESKVQMEFAMLRSGNLQVSSQVNQPPNHQQSLQGSLRLPAELSPALNGSCCLVTLSGLIKVFLDEKAGGWTEKA